MKKVKLFSARKNVNFGDEVCEMYFNFNIIFSKHYGFTFNIEVPNWSWSDRNPRALWKRFLMTYEEEHIRYMRDYETAWKDYDKRRTPIKPKIYEDKFVHCPRCEEALGYKWEHYPDKLSTALTNFKHCWECGTYLDWSDFKDEH